MIIFLWSPFKRTSQGKRIRSYKHEMPTGYSFTPVPWSPCSLEQSSVRPRNKELHSLCGDVKVVLLLKKAQYHMISGTLDGEGWGKHLVIFLIRITCIIDSINVTGVVFNVVLLEGHSYARLAFQSVPKRLGIRSQALCIVEFVQVFWYSDIPQVSKRYCPHAVSQQPGVRGLMSSFGSK